jgi:hypothetical protein
MTETYNYKNLYGYKCVFCSKVNLSKFNTYDQNYSFLQMENILLNLPKIDTDGMSELMSVIEQSKRFTNPRSSQLPTNDFEILYANYIATNNKEFLNTYLTVLTEACFREFMEWYEYITKHILKKDIQKSIGINLDANCSDWETEFKKSKLIGWAYQLTDISIFLENIDHVNEIGILMQKFFNVDRRSHSISDADYFESEHAQLVLDSVSKILLNGDMQELKNQADSDKILCMIETYGWENRFNPILLSWICDNRERIKQWV